MNCFKCGSENIGTLDTRKKFHSSFSQVRNFFKSGENIIRKKRCAKCNHTFFTKELFLESVEPKSSAQPSEKKKIKISKPKPKPKPRQFNKYRTKVKTIMSAKEIKHKSTDSLFDEVEDLEDRVSLEDIGRDLGIDFNKN